MTTNRRTTDGPPRRTPEHRSWARSPGLALLLLAGVGLIQAGCAYDGCSNCGLSSIGNKIGNGVQAVGASVFKHFDHNKGGAAGCSTCGDVGGGYEGGTVIDSGVPMSPGVIMTPAPTVIQAQPADEPPSILTPALPPAGTSGNSTSSRSTPSGNTKSAYVTSAPRANVAQGRTKDVNQAVLSTPRSTDPADPSRVLDRVEPFDLSADVTRKAASAPIAPTPAATPAPAATNPVVPPTAENNSAAEGLLSLPPIVAVTSRQAPGIRRSSSVSPSVEGGTAPSIDGLDWLKEKGFRTFVDLRQTSEIDPQFADAVNDRGMLYISLPIMVSRLDRSRLARFSDLISHSENRPLYFCDTDGTRAGLLWYLHLRDVDHEEAQAATQKAEEIGLTAEQAKLGEAFLAANPSKAKPTPVAPKVEEKPAAAPSAVAPAAPPTPALPAAPPLSNPTPDIAPRSADAPPEPMLPDEDRPQVSRPANSFSRDPSSWKALAALVMAGLGVPLAYWSRSAISGRSIRRASLPGPAREPKALPPVASGA